MGQDAVGMFVETIGPPTAAIVPATDATPIVPALPPWVTLNDQGKVKHIGHMSGPELSKEMLTPTSPQKNQKGESQVGGKETASQHLPRTGKSFEFEEIVLALATNTLGARTVPKTFVSGSRKIQTHSEKSTLALIEGG